MIQSTVDFVSNISVNTVKEHLHMEKYVFIYNSVMFRFITEAAKGRHTALCMDSLKSYNSKWLKNKTVSDVCLRDKMHIL
jgi:hypothetical protein